MQIEETKLKDCFIIKDTLYKDPRGYFFESFNQQKFNELTGLNVQFVQDNQSKSSKGVLRGLHFQKKFQQAKLVYVLKGKILDVVIDLRKKSKTFGKFFAITLSENNCKSLYVPEGFAHGYYCLEKENIIYYRLSDHYSPNFESGLIWNDPEIGINWPNGKKILSKKDKSLKNFNLFYKKYKGL